MIVEWYNADESCAVRFEGKYSKYYKSIDYFIR